jgi:hypothetical protein
MRESKKLDLLGFSRHCRVSLAMCKIAKLMYGAGAEIPKKYIVG